MPSGLVWKHLTTLRCCSIVYCPNFDMFDVQMCLDDQLALSEVGMETEKGIAQRDVT